MVDSNLQRDNQDIPEATVLTMCVLDEKLMKVYNEKEKNEHSYQEWRAIDP